MTQCIKCISLCTLCTIHHFVMANEWLDEVTARTATISTDVPCTLIDPPSYVEGRTEEYKYHVEIYYDNDEFTPSFINANSSFSDHRVWGTRGTVLSLKTMYMLSIDTPRKRANFWGRKVHRRPVLIIIFATEKFVMENLFNTSYLSIPKRDNVDSKVHGFFVVTEDKIRTVKNCGSGVTPEFGSLMHVLRHCNYTYNACLCDTKGNSLTAERCGDTNLCSAMADREDGYVCNSCSSKYWSGKQCDKSIMLFGLISIAVISATSLCGALFAPFQKSPYYPDFQGCMIAVAVGCLTGDAILHLIPIIFGLHGHSHGKSHKEEVEKVPQMESHDVIQRGLTMMAGLYVFYLFETIITVCRQYRTNQNERNSSIKKSKCSQTKNVACNQSGNHHMVILEKCYDEECENNEEERYRNKNLLENDGTDYEDIHPHGGHGHSHGAEGVAMVGWMVILGDGLHNFADGLAIAASFSASYTIGLGTVMAVFFHELPHELGDFAVLLGSGMSVKQAMFWNLMSAFTCFLGFFVGMAVSDTEEVGNVILAIAAGAFTYIALVDMLPEIRIQRSTAHPFRRFAFHQVGLISGALIMWLIAKYEEHLIHFFSS